MSLNVYGKFYTVDLVEKYMRKKPFGMAGWKFEKMTEEAKADYLSSVGEGSSVCPGWLNPDGTYKYYAYRGGVASNTAIQYEEGKPWFTLGWQYGGQAWAYQKQLTPILRWRLDERIQIMDASTIALRNRINAFIKAHAFSKKKVVYIRWQNKEHPFEPGMLLCPDGKVQQGDLAEDFYEIPVKVSKSSKASLSSSLSKMLQGV